MTDQQSEEAMKQSWWLEPEVFEQMRQNFTTAFRIEGPNMNLPQMSEKLHEFRDAYDQQVERIKELEAQLAETQLAEDGAMQIIATERAEVLALCRQLAATKAREAVAYEVAAQIATDREAACCDWWQKTRTHANVYEQLPEVASQIRALTPDDTTTALEQIKQEARDEILSLDWRKLWLENYERMKAAGESKEMAGRWFPTLVQTAASNTTLSEQKENSDE